MTEPTVKLLVLDGHGVVLTNPFQDFLVDLAQDTGQTEMEVKRIWNNRLRTPFWTGELAESEMWRLLTGRENGDSWRWALEERYDLGPAADHLRRWSQAIPVWLLSNHRRQWLLPRLERFGLDRHFRRIVVSDEIGFAKPEPAAFSDVLASVQHPAEALFVDDRTRNVDAASLLGIRTVRATAEENWIETIDNLLG